MEAEKRRQERVEQVRQAQLSSPPSSESSESIRDEDEEDEGPVIPSGITLEWSRAPGQEAQLEQDFSSANKVIQMDIINLDDIDYVGTAVVTGDSGTMQSRSNSSPLPIEIAANSLHMIEVDFSSASLQEQSYSGAAVVQVELCPRSEKTPCLSALSFPLYFHPHPDEGKGMQFYGEKALRNRYQAGDLDKGEGPGEPGLRRVMGGGPLHDLPDEEISPPEEKVDPDDEKEALLQKSTKAGNLPVRFGLHHVSPSLSKLHPAKAEGVHSP